MPIRFKTHVVNKMVDVATASAKKENFLLSYVLSCIKKDNDIEYVCARVDTPQPCRSSVLYYILLKLVLF